MGKASKIQINSDWGLEETVRQVEQKFATDLKTIAGETTNDEKLLQNTGMHRAKTNGTNTRRVQRIHKTFINEIRGRLL